MASLKHFRTYETYTKLRWKNQPLIEVLVKEFRTRTRDYYQECIEKGVITVNGNIVRPEYKLRELDMISHTVHCHEPVPPEIKIIKEEEEYTVINKPAGIPAHPTGGYFYYSVTKSLFPDECVGCVNRLDMPVSGVMIIARKNHMSWYEKLVGARKLYVARVKGLFPDHAEVDAPLGTINGSVHCVTEKGKPSKTIFRRLKHEGGYSIVLCQPITGRTHQIRIHLKHIGFPIVNDILYGDGVYPDSVDFELTDKCEEDISGMDDVEKYLCVIKHCKGENNRSFFIKDSMIYLHAWRYYFNGTVYEAALPTWANLDSSELENVV